MKLSDLIRSLTDAVFGPSGATVLNFDGSSIKITGNKVLQRTANEVRDLLVESGCKRANITLRADGRIMISGGVSEHLHQRIRNLIASS
jgi:hypothetical protein